MSSNPNDTAGAGAGSAAPDESSTATLERVARLHLRLGWCSLLVFLSLGILLEFLHGFRIAWYMNVGDPETRRLMWTLAHAHGTLFSLLHIGLGLTAARLDGWRSRSRTIASYALMAGGILLPLGFLLGGVFVYDGDPGLGIFLVPPGALLMLVAVGSASVGVWRATAARD